MGNTFRKPSIAETKVYNALAKVFGDRKKSIILGKNEDGDFVRKFDEEVFVIREQIFKNCKDKYYLPFDFCFIPKPCKDVIEKNVDVVVGEKPKWYQDSRGVLRVDIVKVTEKRPVVDKIVRDYPIKRYKNNIFLIEYDGEQHFKAIEEFGGEETLKLTKKHDKIKNDFCKKEKITINGEVYTPILFRIPFDADIEKAVLNICESILEERDLPNEYRVS